MPQSPLAILLDAAEGLGEGFRQRSGQALPANLRETAYALACDVAAAERGGAEEELRGCER